MAAKENGRSETRIASRSNVFLAATLYTESGAFPVRIRNISDHGAMLEGAGLPGEGKKVRIQRATLSASAEIAWQRDQFRGLWFKEPIELGSWMKTVGHSGQRRVDMVLAALRQGTPRQPQTLPAATAPDDLAVLGKELLEICERLAALPNMSVQLAEELLKIDGITQALLKLGSPAARR
jgi:hypothetical protein